MQPRQKLTFRQTRQIIVVLTSLGQQLLPRDTLNMSTTAAPTAVVPPPMMGIITGAPTWNELFVNTEQIFTEPVVEFGVLAASLFTSADTPETLLAKLEALA